MNCRICLFIRIIAYRKKKLMYFFNSLIVDADVVSLADMHFYK